MLLAIAAAPVRCVAQERDSAPLPSPDLRLAAGIVRQAGIFGDDAPKSSSGAGFVASFLVRGQMTRRTGASFELTLQPVGIDNPHFDETLRTVFALGGAEIGRTFYVRPAFGIGLQFWSGTSAESSGDIALAAGLSVGRRRVGSNRTDIEAILRCAGSPGALGWLVGVQVPVGVSRQSR
jgi:hypothetical protein